MEDFSKKMVEAMFAKDPELKAAAEKVFKTDLEGADKETKKDDPSGELQTPGKSRKPDYSEIGRAKIKAQKESEAVKKDLLSSISGDSSQDKEISIKEKPEVSSESKDDEESLEIDFSEDKSKPHFERCYAKMTKLLQSKGSVPTDEEFKKLKSDLERFRFVRELGVLDEVVDLSENHEMKCYESAIKRREFGNGMFKKKYYADAHELYTQSIQLFPVELNDEMRTELSKSYANRATTACHMNEFRACLVDIQRAFELGYPLALKHKMYEKQGKCYKQLKDYDQAVISFRNAIQNLQSHDLPQEKKKNIITDLKKQLSICESLARDAGSNPVEETEAIVPELSKSRHDTLMNASSLIDIAYNDQVGRHGVAKQDIHVGDVLVVEKPYASVVVPPFYDTHCYYCFKRLKAPVPCDCCTTARYCSVECKEKGFNEFHAPECGLLYYIDSTDNCWGHLAYRIIVKLGWQRLLEFRTFLDENDVKWNEYGVHGEVIESDDYRCVHSLVTHADDRTGTDLFYRAVKAAYLVKCLEKSGFFPEKVDPSMIDFTGGLLLSNLQLCPCNAHEVSELQIQKSDLEKTKTAEIGAGLYPTLSLFNHSCDPNVVRYFYNDVCVTRAIHHIKKGEEIVDNYGALYPTQKLEERREHLKNQYFFECQCKACKQDWPLYKDMASGEEAPPVLKCEKCGEALMPEKDGGLEEYPCPGCGHQHNILQRMGALDQSHDRFAVAIESVLKGDRTAVRPLEEHLDLMDRLLYLPWKMFNNAQEALKHNYGVTANCFSLP